MRLKLIRRKHFRFSPQRRAGMTLIEVVMALLITGLMIAGIVTGYIYCATSAIKAGLAQAANAKALERMEQTRSAQWDISSYPVIDQLVASNFPDEAVTLDMPGTNSACTLATIRTTIAQISTTPQPQVRMVHVDCIWQFRGSEWITNSIETCRAPDQ